MPDTPERDALAALLAKHQLRGHGQAGAAEWRCTGGCGWTLDDTSIVLAYAEELHASHLADVLVARGVRLPVEPAQSDAERERLAKDCDALAERDEKAHAFTLGRTDFSGADYRAIAALLRQGRRVGG